MKYRHAKVRTVDSYTFPGRPSLMELDGESMEIEQILSHWREAHEDPGFYPEEFYEVKASDKKVYILRYCILFDSWWAREHRRAS